jgi:hypothetical protein
MKVLTVLRGFRRFRAMNAQWQSCRVTTLFQCEFKKDDYMDIQVFHSGEYYDIVFQDVSMCNLGVRFQHFGGTCYLYPVILP